MLTPSLNRMVWEGVFVFVRARFSHQAEAVPYFGPVVIYRREMGRAFNRLPLGKRHEIYAAQLRKQATPAENLFRAHLAALGLPYRFQHGIFKPQYRIVDFYLPEQNLVVEIDGGYHD